MKISVIIPLFNKQNYVEHTLCSVIKQTCQQFELIVVNDGSTDNSLKVVESLLNTTSLDYKIIDQPNQGVSMARNNGVIHAKYEYVAFLDADDWWEPTYIEEMRTLISEFPNAMCYASSYNLVKNKCKTPAKIGVDSNFTKGYIDYFKVYAETMFMPINSSGAIIPKQVFINSGGFSSELSLGEDFLMWFSLAIKGKVAYLNKCLVNYNQDIPAHLRAIGRLHEPQKNILFHLSEYEAQIDSNKSAKILFDKLRLYGFYPYYLDTRYKSIVKSQLQYIDKVNYLEIDKYHYNRHLFLINKLHYGIRVRCVKMKKWLTL